MSPAVQPLWSLYPAFHLGRNGIERCPHTRGNIHNKEKKLAELHGNREESLSATA